MASTSPNISLTTGNDTLRTDSSLMALLNTGNSFLDILNKVVDAGSGTDTFSYSDAFTNSPYFQLSVTSDGAIKLVATSSSASGGGSGPSYVVLKNFEKLEFSDVTLSLLPSSGVDVLNGNASNNALAGKAGNDWLFGQAGNDTLDGGAGNDTMQGGTGNDTFVVNTSADRISDTSGTDTVRVATPTSNGNYTLPGSIEHGELANTVAFNLTGNTLANSLKGNAAANALVGGAGADTLNGGAGADTLTGGTGNDVFRLASSPGSTNVDTIKDFANGDRIALSAQVFKSLGASGGSVLPASAFHAGATADATTDRILYDATSGKLYYDPTGSDNGNADRVQIALVGTTSHPALEATDFLVS